MSWSVLCLNNLKSGCIPTEDGEKKKKKKKKKIKKKTEHGNKVGDITGREDSESDKGEDTPTTNVKGNIPSNIGFQPKCKLKKFTIYHLKLNSLAHSPYSNDPKKVGFEKHRRKGRKCW